MQILEATKQDLELILGLQSKIDALLNAVPPSFWDEVASACATHGNTVANAASSESTAAAAVIDDAADLDKTDKAKTASAGERTTLVKGPEKEASKALSDLENLSLKAVALYCNHLV